MKKKAQHVDKAAKCLIMTYFACLTSKLFNLKAAKMAATTGLQQRPTHSNYIIHPVEHITGLLLKVKRFWRGGGAGIKPGRGVTLLVRS